MNLPVTIRHATLDDAAAMARLHVMTWQAAYRDMLPASFLQSLDIAALTPGWNTEIAKTLEADAPSHIMLADTEHGPQGFVIFGPGREGVIAPTSNPNYKLGQIYSLYVMPAFLKLGLGHAMLNAAFEELRREKYTDIYLTVLEANLAAHKFYERQGGINANIKTTAEIGGKDVPSRAYWWALNVPSDRW